MPASPAQEYAQFYASWERELNASLRQAAKELGQNLPKGNNIGAQIARSHAISTKKAINQVLGKFTAKEYEMLKQGRINAAMLSAKIVHQAERDMLAQVFSKGDLDAMLRAETYRAVAGVEAAIQRLSTSAIPLSEQVYKTNALAKGWVDRAVTVGLAQGLSADQLAAKVRSMINPDVAGGVSYASKRLARTEINNAFHASSVARLKASPWTESVKWNLSGSHTDPDVCNEYAQNDNMGIGEGLWPPEAVPNKPHPQCLCFITAELPTDEQWVDNYLNGNYDKWLDETYPDLGLNTATEFEHTAKAVGRSSAPVKARDYKPLKRADALKKYTPTNVSAADRETIRLFTQGKANDLAYNLRTDINGGKGPQGWDYLKKSKAASDRDLIKDVKAIKDHMTPLDSDTVVWRGMHKATLFDGDIAGSVGRVFEERSFMSTTLEESNKVMQSGAIQNAKPYKIIMEVRVPAGTRAMYVEKFSDFAWEHELVLDTGQVFRVVDVTKLPGGKWKVVVQIEDRATLLKATKEAKTAVQEITQQMYQDKAVAMSLKQSQAWVKDTRPLIEKWNDPMYKTRADVRINAKALGLRRKGANTLSKFDGTPAQNAVVDGYTQTDYASLNKTLRNMDELSSKAQAKVDALDEIMAKEQLPDVTVYRGITTNVSDDASFMKRLQPGDTFRDRGYVSTSTDEAQAQRFTWDRPDSIKVTIDVPNGTRGIYIAGDQQEVLLARNLKFEVVSKTTDSRGMTLIHLRVVPDEPAKLVKVAKSQSMKLIRQKGVKILKTDEQKANWNVVVNEFDRLQQEFPLVQRSNTVLEVLDGAVLPEEGPGLRLLAKMDIDQFATKLQVNSDVLTHMFEASVRVDVANGFRVGKASEPLKELIRHEFGHNLHGKLTPWQVQDMFSGIAERMPGMGRLDDFATFEEWMKDGATFIRQDVSEYATTDSYELIAELFAQAANDYEHASRAARFVWDFMKDNL